MASFFSPASITTRPGRSTAFVLLIAAAVTFGAESRAQNADVYFHPAPLSVPRDSIVAPQLPLSFEDYAVQGLPRTSSLAPKLDFKGLQAWKEYPLEGKDNSEDSFGRVPLNGGSFGLEAEQKLDLKKIGPSSEYVESNIEKNAKRPFVGFSIVTPYSSE